MSRASRCVSLILFSVAGGCVAIDERRTGPGTFEIAAPASEFVNSEERARYLIRLRAQELCRHGFDRLRESRIVDRKAMETIIWDVMCRTSESAVNNSAGDRRLNGE